MKTIVCPVCGCSAMKNNGAKFCSRKCKGVGRKPSPKHCKPSIIAHFKRLLCDARRGRYITIEEVMEMHHSQGGRCALSGIELEFSAPGGGRRHWRNASLDQIVPCGGYRRENVRIVCLGVNFFRSNMSDCEFMEWCRLVSENHV